MRGAPAADGGKATPDDVQAALIERAFCFDVMLHNTFTKGTVKGGAGWTADPLTRYVPPVIKGTMIQYEDPKSKRCHKGREAIPSGTKL